MRLLLSTYRSIAAVEMDQRDQEPEEGPRRDTLGIHSLSKLGAGRPVRRCDVL